MESSQPPEVLQSATGVRDRYDIDYRLQEQKEAIIESSGSSTVAFKVPMYS